MARRLQKELQSAQESDVLQWAKVELVDENLFKWKCTVIGPAESPYEGGHFTFLLNIPVSYPFKPPEVIFQTKVYHPNILQKDGRICAEILKNDWSPQIKMPDVLAIVRHMLAEPNIDNPLEESVGSQWRDDRESYNKTAQEWTKLYATNQ